MLRLTRPLAPHLTPQGGVARRFARSEWGGTSARFTLIYLFQRWSVQGFGYALYVSGDRYLSFDLSQPPALIDSTDAGDLVSRETRTLALHPLAAPALRTRGSFVARAP